MKVFRDLDGGEWRISLSIGDVGRVKGVLGVDLLEPMLTVDGQPPGPNGSPPPLCALLQTDFLQVLGRLRVVLEPEIEKRCISVEEFGRLLGGDQLHEAQRAFMAEWSDFSRGLGLTHHAKAIEAHAELLTKLLTAMGRKAETVNVEAIDVERLMKKAMSGTGSTRSPARSGSTRGR